ncbi:bis(5'-nucleosyl)-tetraphosphatase (symmetrical) YqeK [Clostridium chrysemydis]|uniref:bis(5'-nucleosyl)-tetraphosphatase (symmetrical) YqeK n=1 Tax=Clostridium chrysemydis TaxID=2665504 RepID=UPI00188439A0
MMNYEIIYNYLKENLEDKRFIHTMGVVSTAKKLANLYGVDEKRAEIAALCHDICKNLSNEELLEIFKNNNIELSISEKNTQTLWHSIAAPIVAKEKFNINDEEILGAMRWHTTGKLSMTKLEKIIYIADMIEPSRRFDGVEEIREAVLKDLDSGVLIGVNHTIRYLLDRGNLIDENTIAFRNGLILNL